MMHFTNAFCLLLALLSVLVVPAGAQEVERPGPISGVYPHLAAVAGHAPRSEAGIGALMPWADRLWFVNYPAHKAGTGTGHGLYSVDADLTLQRHPESVVGTYANRMIHAPTHQLFIGPYAIDTLGDVRVIESLVDERLTATARHLTDPENKVLVLAMEGNLYEVDVQTLEATPLFDMNEILRLPEGATAHYKSLYTGAGRVVVANNTYHEEEHLGTRSGGRLAEWDGEVWTILEENPFVEVAGNTGLSGDAIFALGWDRASVLFKVYAGDGWSTYRLPMGSHVWNHAWNTEWMRIREVETERLLMDAHGLFYELPLHLYEGKVWGIKPIARHLRVVPDFAAWRGLLVMAGNQTAVAGGNEGLGGQPQSNLWFGKTDDLFQFGKPTGWGGPWWEEPIEAGTVSDPFLMTGFDKKVVHLRHDASEDVTFTIEIDFLGNGTWVPYAEVVVPAASGYAYHTFPDAFSAHWVRLRTSTAATVTAMFFYN